MQSSNSYSIILFASVKQKKGQMNSLFAHTYNTALLDLSGPPKKDVPAQSEKLDALEKELRSEAKADKTQRRSEIAGSALNQRRTNVKNCNSMHPKMPLTSTMGINWATIVLFWRNKGRTR